MLPMRQWLASIALALVASQAAVAAGRLEVAGAWIRTAPPGAMMLAGYATLSNAGDAPLMVTGADSEAFGDVSLHESVEVDGVARMKALGSIEIAPGASVVLAPGGKHLMLMQPRGEVKPGQKIPVELVLGNAQRISIEFVVSDEAPAAPPQ